MIFRRKPKAPAVPHYQYYANVNPYACSECLLRHGELFTDLAQAPPQHEGCRCECLPVDPEQFKACVLKAERMQQKAQGELRRRRLFQTALTLLESQDLEQFLVTLRASVAIDIYIEELAAMNDRFGHLFKADPNLMRTLRKLFVSAYYKKMDQPKYQLISPGLYDQLETQGRKWIQTTFADPVCP